MTDKKLCSLPDPKNMKKGCLLPEGHTGNHYAGGFHWEEKNKPSSAKKAAAVAPQKPREKPARERQKAPEPSDDGPDEDPRIVGYQGGPNVPGPAPQPSAIANGADQDNGRPKIGEHSIHPAAALFPMIADAEWPAFLDDIRTNGQRKKIVRLGDLVLDGRNRLRACLELGIEPRFRSFGSDLGDGTDPIAFVISENIHRRHLDETARAWIGVELVPMYEAQARERQRMGVSPNTGEGATGKATELAARAVNVGKTSIEAGIKVKRDAAPEVVSASRERGLKVSAAAELAELPKEQQREIVDKVGKGEIRAGKVRSLVRQEKKREVVRKINAQGVESMPAGPFGVIYGDYPWLYENSDQHDGSRGHLPYPPMTMDQILAHARDTASRAGKDCIVALWVTNAYITKIGHVIEAFGAEHRTMLTWPKPRAGVGTWPRGQTEHLVIASIGAPVHTLNEITTLLPSFEPEFPDEHSSKPAEVAELLLKHCCGPFLELFGRSPREGFTVWGAESSKFATEAA